MWNDLSFLMYSTNAVKALKALGKTPKTSKMINPTGTIDEASLSRTLRKLRERRLVVCLTPDRPNNRFFKRTAKGSTLLAKLKRDKLI